MAEITRDPAQAHNDEVLSNFLGEEVVNGSVVQKPTEEEKPEGEQEAVQEEQPKTEETVETSPAAPPIDIDKLKNELRDELTSTLTEQAAEKAVNKLLEQLPEETPEQEKKPIDFSQAPWIKENREPTVNDILEFSNALQEGKVDELKASVKQEVLDELNREVSEEEQNEKTAREREDAQTKALNLEWDRQIDDLVSRGKLATKGSQENQKQVAQIFQAMFAENKKRETDNAARQAQGQPLRPLVTSLLEVSAYYMPATQPAGAKAPIAGASDRSTPTPADHGDIKYEDIHNKSFAQILAEGQRPS